MQFEQAGLIAGTEEYWKIHGKNIAEIHGPEEKRPVSDRRPPPNQMAGQKK